MGICSLSLGLIECYLQGPRVNGELMEEYLWRGVVCDVFFSLKFYPTKLSLSIYN
jgi:hypothetical protein